MKELGKKENLIKNQLINKIIIYSIILIAFIVFLFYYIIPNISDISAKKDILLKNISYFKEINTKGISYADFQIEKNNLNINDSYTKNIVSSMDQGFYNDYFLNKTQDNYLTFLDKLKDSSVKEYNSSEFAAKKSKLESLLPVYSDSSLSGLDNVIDDSKLVNYIENLLDRFNLVNSDGINVGNLNLYEDNKLDKTQKNNSSLVESDIYYFSIPMNLTGNKKDIINFIHYLENVASIKVNGDNIVLYKDNFISPNTSYDGEIAEIDSIKIPDYIDSDNTTSTNNQDVLSFIKNNQGQEKMNISITIKFFVKGLAGYKVQELAKNTTSKYQNLLKDINTTLKTIDQKNPNMLSLFTSLTSIKRYLETIKTDIEDLQKKANKKENMGDVYNKISKFSTSIDKLSSVFIQEKKQLDLIKK